MVFDNPGALWLLPFLPFVLLGLWLVESMTKREAAGVLRLDVRRLETRLVEKYVLAGVLSALLVGAFALPKLPFSTEQTPKKAGEIALLVDVSASMAAQKDLNTPNRLQRVKPILNEIIDSMEELGEVRISLDGFTIIARSLVPFVGKEDYPYLRESIKRLLGTNAVPGSGSSLGQPLSNVADKFSAGEKAKLVVLFSDGDIFVGDTNGMNDVEKRWTDAAIKTANDKGIKVITVGVGERAGARIPLYDSGGFTGEYGQLDTADYVSHLEEGELVDIAARTGGRYFQESEQAPLINYIKENLRSTTASETVQQLTTYRSIAPWFILAALPIWVVFARRHLLG